MDIADAAAKEKLNSFKDYDGLANYLAARAKNEFMPEFTVFLKNLAKGDEGKQLIFAASAKGAARLKYKMITNEKNCNLSRFLISDTVRATIYSNRMKDLKVVLERLLPAIKANLFRIKSSLNSPICNTNI